LIDQYHREIEDMGMQFATAATTDARRELEAEIDWRNEEIRRLEEINQGNYEYVQHLDEADMEHQRYLEETQAEEARQLLEENQDRIDGLQGARDSLASLRADFELAESKYNELFPAAPATTPATILVNGVDVAVTQEMLDFAEGAYFDVDVEVKELERKIKEVEGLKEAVDQAA
jgi:hypothetical protein